MENGQKINKIMEIEKILENMEFVMNTRHVHRCLPSWHHGKRRKLSWKSHGIL